MYLIVILFLLIVLLQFRIYENIILLLIILTISYLITNDIKQTLIISIITFVLIIILNNDKKNILMERFEEEDKSENHHDEETKERVKHLKSIINKLESGISIKDEDMIEKNNIKDFDFDTSKVKPDDEISIKNKDVKDYTPSEAQQKTYELINTVKQLDDTIKTLGPTLEIGKQVLDKMKQYKL